MGRELALDLSRRNIHVSGNEVVGNSVPIKRSFERAMGGKSRGR